MSAEILQGAVVLLLTVIGVAAVLSLVLVHSALRTIRMQQEATNRILSGKDVGPALHGLGQQSKEICRLLANIDKRLEKLEALEKVQIANMAYRQEMNRKAQGG